MSAPPPPAPAPPTPLALFDTVEAHLRNVKRDRPLTGVAAAGWTMMALAFTAFAGVVIAIVLATLGALITDSPVGAGIGGIIGLLLSTRIPARPHRDWRERLKKEGFRVSQSQGATDVGFPIEGVRIVYRFHPGGTVVEALWLKPDPPLPTRIRVAPNEAPTGDLAFDRVLGLRATEGQRICFDTPVRDALRALAPHVRIEGGQVQIELGRDGFALGPQSFDPLVRAVRQLAHDLADPPHGHARICTGAPFDAAQAIARLAQRDAVPPEADPALVALVAGCLAGEAADALARSTLSPAAGAQAIAGLCRQPGLVSVDALHAAALDRASACAPDEAGTLEAAEYLLAVRADALVDRVVHLGDVGAQAALIWLSQTPFPATIEPVVKRAKVAIQARLRLDGALTIELSETRGAVAISETGHLSEPDTL